MLKQNTSFQHARSSHPPKSQATLSMSVTVCARMPCASMWPYVGARLQCMSVAGAGSASLVCGRCGVLRTRCVGGAVGAFFPSRPSRSRPSLPSRRSRPSSRPATLLSSRSLSLSRSRSRPFTVAGDPERCRLSTGPTESPLAERTVGVRVIPDGVRWPAADGVREGTLPRLVVLAEAALGDACLNVVAEPVTAWWK